MISFPPMCDRCINSPEMIITVRGEEKRVCLAHACELVDLYGWECVEVKRIKDGVKE